jgi:hypothetical protein
MPPFGNIVDQTSAGVTFWYITLHGGHHFLSDMRDAVVL